MQSNEFKYIILMPAYNEETNIYSTISSVPDFIDIVVINDGSIDNTLDEVNKTTRKLVILNHTKNTGKGSAIITGLKYLKEQDFTYREKVIVILMDADGQMDSSHIIPMAKLVIEKDADLIKGTRFYKNSDLDNMPRFRKAGNFLLKWLNRISTGFWSLTDPQNGFHVFRLSLFDNLDIETLDRGYYFENSFLHLMSINNKLIVEYPVKSIYNIGENSNLIYSSFIPKTIYKLARDWIKRLYSTYNKNLFRRIVTFGIICGTIAGIIGSFIWNPWLVVIVFSYSIVTIPILDAVGGIFENKNQIKFA